MKVNRLVISSVVSIAIRFGGAVSALILNREVLQSLPVNEAGVFLVLANLALFLSVFGLIGMPNNSLRLIGIWWPKNEYFKIKRLTKSYFFLAVISLTIITLCSYFFMEFFFSKLSGYPFFFLCIFGIGIQRLSAFMLQAIGKTMVATLLMSIAVPLFSSLCMYALDISNIEDLTTTYILVTWATAAVAVVVWLHSIKSGTPHASKFWSLDFNVFRGLGSMWLVAILGQWILWGGQFIATDYLDAIDLAKLTTAQRVASVVSLVLVAISIIVSPKFAQLYDSGNKEQLQKALSTSIGLAMLFSLPFLLLISIFPQVVVTIFGNVMIDTELLIVIFALAQLINAITGPVSQLLLMSGNAWAMVKILFASAILLTILSYALIPLVGVLGAAISTLVAFGLQNILALGVVRYRLDLKVPF